jgi:hypothetical protein
MPPIPRNTGDAIELAELLGFLGDRLESDHDSLTAALALSGGIFACAPNGLTTSSSREGSRHMPVIFCSPGSAVFPSPGRHFRD